MKAHLISIGIGVALIGACAAAGYPLDGLSWAAGGLYAFADEACRRGRK